MDHCKTNDKDILQSGSGENGTNKTAKEFEVLQLNSAGDSANPVENPRRVKRQKTIEYIFLSLFLFFTIAVFALLGFAIKERYEERLECTDFHAYVCKDRKFSVLTYFQGSHTLEMIRLLSMDGNLTTMTDKSQDKQDAKEKARIFFHSCLKSCRDGKLYGDAITLRDPNKLENHSRNGNFGSNPRIFSLNQNETEDDCSLTCQNETALYFEYAVVALLLESSPIFSKPGGWTPVFSAVREMAENIREELIKLLEKSQWHNEGRGVEMLLGFHSGLAGLVEKARKVRIKIGYPTIISNPQRLNELYAVVGNMDKSDYFGNLDKILKAGPYQTLSKDDNSEWFGESKRESEQESESDFSHWLERALREKPGRPKILAANAYNLLELNEVIIPVSVLLHPIFDLNQTMAYNYGALGAIIGHELFHGFAPDGLKFDKFGSFQTFRVRMSEDFSSCLVKQYSNFKYDDGSNLNGTLTLEENIADNGGLRIAMKAFLNILDRQRTSFSENDFESLRLKELRRFFASYAMTRGGGGQEGATGDTHSPDKFRVLGPLQNIREFSEAFYCPQQSSQLECPNP